MLGISVRLTYNELLISLAVSKKNRRGGDYMKRILLLLSLCLFLFTVPSKAADIPVRETDVTTASEGNDIVLLNGTFKYLTKEEILSRINEIRLEACKEGVPDPRNSLREIPFSRGIAFYGEEVFAWGLPVQDSL